MRRTILLLCLAFAAPLRAAPVTIEPQTEEARLGWPLIFKVSDLGELQRQTGDKPLGLYLDDVWIEDVPAKVVVSNGAPATQLRFDLVRTNANRTALSKLLGRPGVRSEKVPVAIGTVDRKVFYSATRQIGLPLLSGAKAVAVGLIVALLGCWAIAVVFKFNRMLRDPSADPNQPGPFSLGRVQMAFWFFNIVLAFFIIWSATGASDTITPQLLVLMGVSAGTALGSVLITSSKIEEARSLVSKAKADLARATDANKDAAKTAYDAATQALASATPAAAQVTGGFFIDLLTDANGFSLHRVQMLLWTVVLGVLFWASVWRDLTMPEFDPTLLALMGISAGTYLGFKLPEKQG